MNYQDVSPFAKSKYATTNYFFKDDGTRQERGSKQQRNLLNANDEYN